MKTILTIPHDGYMLTIAEVILALENMTSAKITQITESDGQLSFVLVEPEPEPEQNLCSDCGIKLVECDRCDCCMACCDCDIPL